MAEITWIKLRTDMFDNTKIRLIEKLPEGDTILVIWVKLLAAAGKANCNGYIMLSENIPMNVEEMAVIFDRPLNTVRLAIEAFKRYGMIELDDSEIVRIKNWETHQNIDGMERIREQNRIRKQKQREREKNKELPAPKQDNHVTKNDSHTMSRDSHATETDLDKDIDKELDIEKEKETDKETEKDKKNVSQSSVTEEQLIFLTKFYDENIQRASGYICECIEHMAKENDPALVYEAMKITALQQPNKPMHYTERILANWRKDFITNVEQLKAKEEREKNKRQQSNQSSYKKPTGRTEVVPEWFANRNEEESTPATEPTNNTIDFEAERQKVLEILGKKENVSNG